MKKLFFAASILFLLISCGKGEDPMIREQKEMDKAISGVSLDAYKAFKVALRGTAVAGKDSLFDKARMQLLAAAGYVLVKNQGGNNGNDINDLLETAKQAGAIAQAIPSLLKTDEDSLPTIMENIAFVMDPQNKSTADVLTTLLNEDEEHIVLAASWTLVQRAPVAFCLYEMKHVDDDSLRSIDVQLISKIARSALYLQNSWPYHAEKAADEMVAITEKEKSYLLAHPWPAYDASGKAVTAEQSWHQLHGLALLLRGLCREKMDDREEDALADIDAFAKEAEAGGLDNELTWSAGAYAAIKKEDKEQALNYLDKLIASKNFSADEISSLKEVHEYISKRDKDSALNRFTDKFSLVRISGSYLEKLAMNSTPMQQLRASAGGKEFLRLTEFSPGNLFKNETLNTDSLINKSKSVLKKIGV